jgi:hypothetical protein
MLAEISKEPFALDYDRSGRKWNVIALGTGEIAETFPPKSKAAAFRYAVERYEPELFAVAMRIIGDYPYLERVVWAGVRLVIEDAIEVFPAPVGNTLALVDSSDDDGRYAITWEDGYAACQCAYWQSMLAPLTDTGARVCKHIAGYRMYLRVRESRF